VERTHSLDHQLSTALVNLFLTGDNETGAVTGRVFDENVKEGPENLFFCRRSWAISSQRGGAR